MTRLRPEEGLGLALLAAAAAVFLVEAWPLPPHLDDAYISYRYARNLVAGEGLVYNPGEWVEGYTNLLWTLLVAGGLALGAEAKPTAHALELACGVAVLAATWAYARPGLHEGRAWVAGLAPWIVLASLAFARWTTSGMETALFTALVTAALAAEARGRGAAATVALAAATLTRPDGVVVAAVVFAAQLWRRRAEGLAALAGPAAFAALLLAHTAARWLVYGSPVPNTFYAKVPGVPLQVGWAYLVDFLRDGAIGLVPAAALCALREPAWRAGAALVIVFSAYVVAVGGDVFAHGRFLLPVLPALAVLAVRGVFAGPPVGSGWRGAAAACTAAAAALLVVGPAAETAPKRIVALRQAHQLDAAFEAGARRKWKVIRGRGEPVRLVAATGIGAFGYLSGLPILDLLGLVDPTIARGAVREEQPGFAAPGHLRSEPGYVLGRRPDYLLMPRKGSITILNAHLDLWAHPDFERLYEWDPEVRGYRLRAPEGGDAAQPSGKSGGRRTTS